jgi:glyoxylate/hydroxypyruvate reductase A
MRLIVCLPEEDASPWLDLLAAALPEAAIERRDPGAAVARVACGDYVVAAWPCATLFDEHPHPKAVFTVSAGVAHVLRQPNLPAGVPLIRVEDAGMAPQMVRYALAVAMGVFQRFDVYAAQQRESVWEQHPARDPAAFNVGVLGLGVIGSAIARALVAHGFAVRGHARTPKRIDGVQCHAGSTGLPAFLAGLDLLVSILPHTPDTVGLLDRATLAQLADGAHVVNMGRGSALVEDDLLALLDSGKLAGATLDVLRAEPLPPGHPFWTRPEITITPHVSGLTMPSETVAQIAAKIRRLERGEPVTGVVDRARGY